MNTKKIISWCVIILGAIGLITYNVNITDNVLHFILENEPEHIKWFVGEDIFLIIVYIIACTISLLNIFKKEK